MRIFACVVTYEPDLELLAANLAAVTGQVAGVIVVDNASTNLSDFEGTLDSEIILIRRSANLGLSSAMNLGADVAMAADADALLMLDQDSLVAPEVVHLLSAELAADDRLAIVAAHMVDRNLAPGAIASHGPERVDACITSGSLVRLVDWKRIGGWDEQLFIDYVDFDLCLRLRVLDREIAIHHDALLMHSIGDARRVGRAVAWGHGARRLRHMAADAVHYARKHRRSPRALQVVPRGLLRTLAVLLRKSVVIALHEDQKVAKISAIAEGTFTGLVSRFGRQPSNHERGSGHPERDQK